jgi:hypothetical protein
MVLDLLLAGLAITLEPLPLTAFILLLSSDRGVRKGLAFIAGWLVCLIAVLAIVVGVTGGKPLLPQTSPSTGVLAAKLALGVLLIGLAERQRRRLGRPRKPPTWMKRLDRTSPAMAAALAAFLQPWVLVAIGAATVTQAKVSSFVSYLALALFCLLATASFAGLELYAIFSPEAAAVRLTRLRNWLDAHRDHVIIVICVLLGLWLIGQSSYLLA